MQCAESALKSVIGDLSHTYFVGNAPMGHMVIKPTESNHDLQPHKVVFPAPNTNCSFSFNSIFAYFLTFPMIWLFQCQRFFFKSQVIGASKLNIGKCDNFVWVTKDELLEYFPNNAEFLNKMIIS